MSTDTTTTTTTTVLDDDDDDKKYSPRPLFGGAMVCDIPTPWRDVSNVRQVPDHQEVWQSPQDDEGGLLLVVELLERQPVEDSRAAAFFFEDLAESNAVDERGHLYFQPSDVPLPGTNVEGAIVCAGRGLQKMATGRSSPIHGKEQSAADNHEICWARIELCVLRLPSVHTDLLVTITRSSSNSKEEPHAFAHGSLPWSTDFQRILSSLQVQDWGLFGSSTAEGLDTTL